MNKFIILCILFYSIYCSYSSCLGETTGFSQCKNHDIEFNGFSCYKCDYPIIDDEEDEVEDNMYCIPFPDKSETQKKYKKFILGYYKELGSSIEEMKKEITAISIFKKEKYSKDETITFEIEKLSNEDKKILKGNKTCSYLLKGRYLDNIKKYPSGYPNIVDKNICHNAEQFSDLKGLVNCGYAQIKYYIWDKPYNYSTCYYIPDNNFPEELKVLWRLLYFQVEELFDILEWGDDEYEKNIGNKGNKIFKKSNKRNLQENSGEEYEIIVEDKFGKIIKYSSNSTEMIVLEKGDENATSFSKTNSIYLKINMLFGLLLLLIL